MIPLSDEAILQGIERCCVRTFLRCAKTIPGAILFDDQELEGYHTGIPSPMGNMMLRTTASPKRAEELISQTIELHQKAELPFLWWTSPFTQPTNLGDTLESLGGMLIMATPGMAAPLNPEYTAPKSIPGLEVREVGPKDEELWADTCLSIFNMSKAFAPFFGPPVTDRAMRREAPMVKYLGLLNGEAVATSSFSIIDNILGVFCVGTHESARGMGIGSELTKAPMAAGLELGCDYAVLQASTMGLSVYEKLGFKTYGSFNRYLFAPPASITAEAEARA